MVTFPLRWLIPAALSLILPLAQAQSAPAGASAPVPLEYRSAFAQYRKFDESPVGPWTEINSTVGKIGGWRTYAKEARQPETTAGKAAATPTDPGVRGDSSKGMPGSHTGHGVKP